MAKVYFTKDGYRPEQAHLFGELFAVSGAAHHFATYSRKYSTDFPVIGESSNLTDYAAYRHVIIQIDSHEVCDAFPHEGFYIIEDLTATQAKSMMEAVSA